MDENNKDVVLLDQNEVAKILKKSTSWMERSRWNGSGPPYRRIGRHIRYPLVELLEWIAGHPLQTSSSKESTTHR